MTHRRRPSCDQARNVGHKAVLWFCAVCCAAVVYGAVCSTSLAATKALIPVTLQLRWFHQFQFAGYYVAKHLGYYQDAGLDVTIREREVCHNVVDAVLRGNATFGVSNSDVLLRRLHGDPLVALAAVLQHSPQVLLARGDSVHNLHDLAGKRVLLSTKTEDVEILAMLRGEHMDMSKIHIVDRFAQAEDYTDPTIDVLAGYITNQAYLFDRDAKPYTVIRPATYGIDFYSDCLFTTEQTLLHRPDMVKAFLEASLKGWRQAMAHPKQAIDLILTEYGSRKSRAHLEYEAQRMRELMLPDLVEIGHMNPGRWQRMAEVFKDLGLASTDAGLEGFVYDPQSKQMLSLRRSLRIALAMWLGAAVLLVVFFIFLARLRREVRQRKRAEDEAARHALALRQIIDLVPYHIFVKNQEGRVLLANVASAGSVGLAPAEYEGRLHADVHPDKEEVARMLEDDRRIIASGESMFSKEQVFHDALGRRRWLRVTKVPYVAATGDAAVLGMAMDVTEEKRTQELLIQTEKMMSVGGLAAGMAHEINNPLAAIMGGVQNAERRLSPDLKPNADVAAACGVDLDRMHAYMERRGIFGYLEGIRDAARRASTVVRGMLEFSRGGVMEKRPCDVHELLETTLRLAGNDFNLGKEYDFLSIPVVRAFDADVPLVLAVPTQIEQVFLNCVKNAAQAMAEKRYEEGGPRLDLRTSVADGMVTVEIEDNGPGLTEEARARLFEPFFTTKPVGQGTGLGLSVSYFIVTSGHGGAIEVESKEGAWTRVSIRLPVA
ncbi:MAG: ABC transporter substrate-binding protein [Desulfovibrionaceae bacterium]